MSRAACCELHVPDRDSPFVNLENFAHDILEPGGDYLPRALTFDAFHYEGTHIEYRSVDHEWVWLRHGIYEIVGQPYEWTMARPPFAEIVDDWVNFATGDTTESFTKTYTWSSTNPPKPSRPSTASTSPTAVTLTFKFMKSPGLGNEDPVAVSDHTDRGGHDFIFELLHYLDPKSRLLMDDLTTRETFSFWTYGGAIRADQSHALIWADPEAAEDDYLHLTRTQFDTIWADFRTFTMNAKPLTRTYEPPPS